MYPSHPLTYALYGVDRSRFADYAALPGGLRQVKLRLPRLREFSVALAILGLAVLAHWSWRVADGKVSYYELGIVLLLALLQGVVRYILPGARITSSVSVVSAEKSRTAALKQLWQEALLPDNDHYSPEMMSDYADILLNPSLFRSRTTETLIVGRETTERRLLIHFRFDAAAAIASPKGLIVPLLVPPKRRLYDQARIEDEHGELLSPLNSYESTKVNVRLLQYLYRSTRGLKKDVDQWNQDEFWDFIDLMDAACRNADMIETESRVKATLERIKNAAVDPISYKKLEMIALLLRERYIVAIVVNGRSEATLSFSSQLATKGLTRRIPNEHSLAPTRWTHTLFHIPSGYLRFPMAQARRCQSYHLYVALPSRSFVGHVAAKSGTQELKTDSETGVVSADPLLRLSKRQRGLLHVYGRGLQDIPGGAEVEGRFFERPYGSELYGVVAALAFLILCIVLREAFLGERDVDPGAVALAVPVGLATFGTLFSSCVRNSVTVSSAGITCGVLTSLLAVLVFAIYLLQESAGSLGEGNKHGLLFWHSAVAFAAVNAAAIMGIFTLRFLRYIADDS